MYCRWKLWWLCSPDGCCNFRSIPMLSQFCWSKRSTLFIGWLQGPIIINISGASINVSMPGKNFHWIFTESVKIFWYFMHMRGKTICEFTVIIKWGRFLHPSRFLHRVSIPAPSDQNCHLALYQYLVPTIDSSYSCRYYLVVRLDLASCTSSTSSTYLAS